MLGTVITIDVDDLERAVDFYVGGLGLRLGRRLFANTVAEMTGAQATIQLSLKEAGSPWSPWTTERRDYRRHWTPVHLDFMVDDVRRATERAEAAGATLEGEIQTFVWGHQATLSDPFGNGFCLIQLVGRGYGEVE
jgi:catechol 2,3-dioxygenase-like lactoylglutathione lyase family enzyme